MDSFITDRLWQLYHNTFFKYFAVNTFHSIDKVLDQILTQQFIQLIFYLTFCTEINHLVLEDTHPTWLECLDMGDIYNESVSSLP